MFGSLNLKSCSDAGLYVHVPFCRAKCRYCGFYSEPIENHDAQAVISAMIAEMDRYEPGDSVSTIYIGGGSPSSLAPEQLLQLIRQAAQLCPAATEFTVEVNPGQVDKKLLGELRSAGANRLSIGAQSFNQRELDFLGRGYGPDCIAETVRQARIAGFKNISLDLIFAIPGSGLSSWQQNLRAAVKLTPNHISAYSLTYEDATALAEERDAGLIEPVDEDTDRAMYELAIDELAFAGLDQYEISNFALLGFECRHNLNCWANNSYIGIGPGATSYLNGTRSTNVANIKDYVRAITAGESAAESNETLAPRQRACETAVLNLRRRSGIDLAEFRSRTGFDFMELFGEPVHTYREHGLIEQDHGRVFLTRPALGIADSILCDFTIA